MALVHSLCNTSVIRVRTRRGTTAYLCKHCRRYVDTIDCDNDPSAVTAKGERHSLLRWMELDGVPQPERSLATIKRFHLLQKGEMSYDKYRQIFDAYVLKLIEDNEHANSVIQQLEGSEHG